MGRQIVPEVCVEKKMKLFSLELLLIASQATNAVEVGDRAKIKWKQCVNDHGLSPYTSGISMVGLLPEKCGRNRCRLQCKDGYLPHSRTKAYCRYNKEKKFHFSPTLMGCEKVCLPIT